MAKKDITASYPTVTTSHTELPPVGLVLWELTAQVFSAGLFL